MKSGLPCERPKISQILLLWAGDNSVGECLLHKWEDVSEALVPTQQPAMHALVTLCSKSLLANQSILLAEFQSAPEKCLPSMTLSLYTKV